MIRVLVAHRQEILRIGLTTILAREPDIRVVAETARLSDALAFVGQEDVDVVLLDAQLDSGREFDSIARFTDAPASRKVLLISAMEDPDAQRRSMLQGANGFFALDHAAIFLPKAIRCVHAGELWIDRQMTSALFQEMRNDKKSHSENNLNVLTASERRIAHLAAQGLPAKKIATSLNISDKTVRNKLVHVYSKLGVTGRIELALKAAQFGLQPEQSPAG